MNGIPVVSYIFKRQEFNDTIIPYALIGRRCLCGQLGIQHVCVHAIVSDKFIRETETHKTWIQRFHHARHDVAIITVAIFADEIKDDYRVVTRFHWVV